MAKKRARAKSRKGKASGKCVKGSYNLASGNGAVGGKDWMLTGKNIAKTLQDPGTVY